MPHLFCYTFPMNHQPYLTVSQTATAELTIERSRFIGHCCEVATEDDAKNFVARIRAEHAQATHNCYAYRVGNTEHPSEYFNDHGEPSGTAGKPILGAIQRLNLTNTVIVVTRYFGGKKLGVRGLIDAYGQTATLVLETAGIVQRIPKFQITLVYAYAWHSTIQHRLQQVEAEIIDTVFAENITLKIALPESKRPLFEAIIQELPVQQVK